MIRPVAGPAPRPVRDPGGVPDRRFEAILAEKTAVRFSNHAQARLASRDIAVSPQDLQRLSDALALAREKGSRDTLVLLDGRAFVLSVSTGTVVTAIPAQAGRVFTNIDSAVVL